MNLRHFEHTERKYFWGGSLRSVVSERVGAHSYCRHHRLNRRTFERWLARRWRVNMRNRRHNCAEMRVCNNARKSHARGQRQRFGVSTDERIVRSGRSGQCMSRR
ncbi:protein of unknown function [Aminobacter niigataensis]|nr:protein of unknown function [Aminobacter niigataensis]